MILNYELVKDFPVSNEFYARLQEKLKDKIISSDIDTHNNRVSIVLNDYLRDIPKVLSINLVEENHTIQKIYIETSVESDELNSYDLRNYLNDFLVEVLLDDKSSKNKKYVIRNYLTYFNSHAMKLDLVVHGKNKMRIFNSDFPYNPEPLNENVLLIDTEIESPSLPNAMSLSYNNARDIGALLSVLLDVGFFTLTSERKIFIQKKQLNQQVGFANFRYRTGYVDSELGIIVKDNLNGMKSAYDGGLEDFFSGVISNEIVLDESQNPNSMNIFRLGSTEKLEQTFLNHSIKKSKCKNVFCESIVDAPHYMNQEIEIPRQLRAYIKNIYSLEKSKYNAFISAARLYNISLTAGLHEPTVEVAYKISALEALGKAEAISFSELLRKYVDFDFDDKLSDYYYGNIRSGHFHAGDFAFNEYSVNLVSEFDFSLKEKIDQKREFEKISRNCFVNWINRNILKTLANS